MMRRRGIVMAEAVLATALVGGLAVAAMSLVSSVAVERQVASERSWGHLLSRQLADEIAALPVRVEADAGGSLLDDTVKGAGDLLGDAVSGELLGEAVPLRTSHDEIMDYDGLSESPPRFRDGSAVPGGDGWTRAVEITEVSATDLEGTEVAGTGVFRVRVTATLRGREAGEVVLYRTTAADGAMR